MDDDRRKALTVATQFAMQGTDPHAGGIHEDAAWIVTRVWRSGRVVVWRIRPDQRVSGITAAMAWWEFSDEEIEAERARLRGDILVTVDMALRQNGVMWHARD